MRDHSSFIALFFIMNVFETN